MPFTINDIKFQYSGGAANGNAALSLGGVISSVAVVSQTASAIISATGLTILSATNNAQGVGSLTWSWATKTLSWQPPTSQTIYGVSITVDGTYAVGGGDGTLIVQAVYLSLPQTYTQDSITITRSASNVFDPVAPMDSLVGDISYRCLYIKNTGSVTVNDTKVWIKSLTTGPDEIDIALDPAGIGNGDTTGRATVISTEHSAPAGVSTWYRPLTYSTGLSIGTLTPGQSIAMWEKRTVPANTTGDIAANQSTIAVAVSI